MDTTNAFTAPLWSADPLTAIDRLGATHDATTRVVLRDAAHSLERRTLQVRDGARLADWYLAAQSSFEDKANAYAALVTFDHLGVTTKIRPPRPKDWEKLHPTPKRVFTPLERATVRLASYRSDIATGQVAAMEAGAISRHLATIAADDLELTCSGCFVLRLPATTYTAARMVDIAPWATVAFTRLIERSLDRPLLYGGAAQDPDDRQSAVLMSVRSTFKRAGLLPDRTVSPESLRNTGARAAHDAATDDRLAAAGQVLGTRNTLRIGQRIGWQPEPALSIIDWDAASEAG